MSELMKHMTRDRVSFSVTRKIAVAQYENFDLHLGLSADRQGDEPIEAAFARVEKEVLGQFDRLMKLIDKGQIKGAKK